MWEYFGVMPRATSLSQYVLCWSFTSPDNLGICDYLQNRTRSSLGFVRLSTTYETVPNIRAFKQSENSATERNTIRQHPDLLVKSPLSYNNTRLCQISNTRIITVSEDGLFRTWEGIFTGELELIEEVPLQVVPFTNGIHTLKISKFSKETMDRNPKITN